jgi:predicted transcriptional regulator
MNDAASRCKDASIRTTLDLPDDLHERAKRIARDSSRTLSETVADLIRRGLESRPAPALARSARTGLPVVSIGHVVTTEDVLSLDDDAWPSCSTRTS